MKLKRAFHNETDILVPGANLWHAVLDESSIIVYTGGPGIVYTGGPGSKPVTLTDQLMTANGREWRPSREHKP